MFFGCISTPRALSTFVQPPSRLAYRHARSSMLWHRGSRFSPHRSVVLLLFCMTAVTDVKSPMVEGSEQGEGGRLGRFKAAVHGEGV